MGEAERKAETAPHQDGLGTPSTHGGRASDQSTETPRQRAARLRLDGLPMSEIAAELGISRQRVHALTKDLLTIGLNLTKEEREALAQRYEREHKQNESLTAWLRRLWIGEVDHKDRS